MGLKTAAASAIIPGSGQIINDQENRAVKIWIGLLLSIVLFPLPVLGLITFIGVYIAGVWDAYDTDHDVEFIHLKTWKGKSWNVMIEKLKKKYRSEK